MTLEHDQPSEPAVRVAVAELQGLIRDHYPTVTFDVGPSDDPQGVYVRATVDVADADEVVGVFLDRMVDIQIDEELPIDVVVVRPPERVARELRARQPPHHMTAVPLSGRATPT